MLTPMREPTSITPDRTPAYARPGTEPTEPVRMRWTLGVTLASIGLWAGFFGPIQVLLALQAAAIVPEHKETTLAIFTGIGALVSVICNPLFGAISDRTISRFGRRLPWVVGGALVGAASLVWLAFASSVVTVVIGWVGVQASLNAMLAALTASIPDLVPVRQRGLVGGWVGAAQTLGVVVGVGVAGAGGGKVAPGYLMLAALVVLLAIPYALRSNDLRLDAAHREPFELGQFARGFWTDPREHPDFGWAWGTRFLTNLANALGTGYLLFYLTDAVHHPDPTAAQTMLILVYAGLLVVSTVIAGVWSDRVGRRRVFVIWAGVVLAGASCLLALQQTFTGALVGACLYGIGFGIYTSVDFALITQVLPDADGTARDLGVINIAAALPQVVAPPIVATVLGVVGADKAGGYRVVYLLGAVIALLGGVLVQRIRSVP